MMVETLLIASTVALTGVTGLAAYPYEVRQRHKALTRARARAAVDWARFKAMLAGERLVWVRVTVVGLVRHHGQWLLWQVTMILPERVRKRERS